MTVTLELGQLAIACGVGIVLSFLYSYVWGFIFEEGNFNGNADDVFFFSWVALPSVGVGALASMLVYVAFAHMLLPLDPFLSFLFGVIVALVVGIVALAVCASCSGGVILTWRGILRRVHAESS